jgi:glycogen debranching enzyme
MLAAADDLAGLLDERWDDTLRTWVDAGPSEASSGRIRTLDALLPLLVTARVDAVESVLADLVDDAAYGGGFGPAAVHRDEPTFSSTTYWRGPAWPQLSYLLWLAADRSGHRDPANELAQRLVAGATTSGFAEYWEPDTGEGLGARPQSWTTLAAVVVR